MTRLTKEQKERFDKKYGRLNKLLNRECECTQRTTSAWFDYQSELEDFLASELALRDKEIIEKIDGAISLIPNETSYKEGKIDGLEKAKSLIKGE